MLLDVSSYPDEEGDVGDDEAAGHHPEEVEAALLTAGHLAVLRRDRSHTSTQPNFKITP
jgi:hypothetical protein